jgi:hypothetical protein
MGKKHETPPELDYLFERDIVDEEDYGSFWEDWYGAKNKSEKQNVINDWLELAAKDEEKNTKEIAGVVTRNRKDAERQAKSINGRIVRRNAKGRFSRTGKSFQAIRKAKRK